MRFITGAGEDVIGGQVDDADIAVRAQVAQSSHRGCVDLAGLVGLLFRMVHIGPGGGVDDEIGVEVVELAGQLRFIADIEFGAIRRP